VGAFVLAACGSDSSERSERRRTTTTVTTAPRTTPTTVGSQTVPVPPTPPPPPATGPPSAITVPPGAPRTTAPDSTPGGRTPRSTAGPTVTAAPGTSPGTRTPAAVTRRTVVFSPPDAPRRRADLVLPRQHGDTIVVLTHGGSGNTGTRKQMRGWANFYAEHGYPSFAIDYQLVRASTPSPVYPKPQTDVKAAVQYLRERAEQLGISPDRIVVQGFDAGAALGAQAGVTPDDAFFDGSGHYANVSDGVAGFVGFYGLYDGEQRTPARYYGGPPDSPDPQVQARYAKANSIAQAANAAGPVLIVHGDAEDNEVVTSGQQFVDALGAAGKDVTLSVVPGASPNFDQENSGELTPAGRQTAQQVLDWLAARFPPV
jgi:acetyl esterase/lipase